MQTIRCGWPIFSCARNWTALCAVVLESGKQFTYALLEERVPAAKMTDRDEALAELTRRYFKSHGPATLQDFVWWSGLDGRRRTARYRTRG